MDRRKFLSIGNMGREPNVLNDFDVVAITPPVSGLSKYSGQWDRQRAWHLLSRTTYGPTAAEISESLDLGLDATIEKLFDVSNDTDLPLTISKADPAAAYGETFVDKARSSAEGPRREALLGWWAARMNNTRFDISEKMTIFWSNHYSTELLIINDARHSYQLYRVLRDNCIGNFRELTKLVTLTPAMLTYLNGDRNIAQSPNENYARELFELFTVGKGTQVAPGDYTNYTEDDIKAAAKALTGWTVRRRSGDDLKAEFISILHDKSTKQFSPIFNNTQLSNQEEDEYSLLIDMIYESDTAAKYLARKLYIYFVNDVIDQTVTSNVIDPLAAIIFEDGYEIERALKTLLASDHFNDVTMAGSMIKTPFDFVADTLNKLGFEINGNNFEEQYRNHLNFFVYYAAAMEQTLSDPPSVAGWPAYYQQPAMYRLWLNSVTLPLRQKITDGVLVVGLRGRNMSRSITVDLIEIVETISNAEDEYTVIDYFTDLYYPVGISNAKREFLRKSLVPEGQPEYFWAYIWGTYLADKENDEVKNGVNGLLIGFFSNLLASAEYQIN